MRTLKALLAAGAVLVAACGSEMAVGQTTTTSTQCLGRDSTCRLDSDCCTLWCVNGVCTRREP